MAFMAAILGLGLFIYLSGLGRSDSGFWWQLSTGFGTSFGLLYEIAEVQGCIIRGGGK